MSSAKLVDPQTALLKTCETLRVSSRANQPGPSTPMSDEAVAELAAATARRLCGFMCPCPPSAIKSAVERSLSHLPGMQLKAEASAAAAVDDLLANGDVLELDQVMLPGAENKPNWLFCAPPSFIPRGHRIYITGIAPDDASFLPIAVRERVTSEGGTRFIACPEDSVELEATLGSFGLRRLDAQRWLAMARPESAETFVTGIRQRLRTQGSPGHIDGFTVLKHRDCTRRGYRARWDGLKNESGLHIARLPQTYGAALWLLIDADQGRVVRSLILPVRGSRSRACDDAWRIQMALDAVDGYPSSYRVAPEASGTVIHLDFPLPVEARRRLTLIGGRRRNEGAFLSFWIPQCQLAEEERFLQQQLWLQRVDINKETP